MKDTEQISSQKLRENNGNIISSFPGFVVPVYSLRLETRTSVTYILKRMLRKLSLSSQYLTLNSGNMENVL
jgi:hypothetical protein